MKITFIWLKFNVEFFFLFFYQNGLLKAEKVKILFLLRKIGQFCIFLVAQEEFIVYVTLIQKVPQMLSYRINDLLTTNGM